ncbi:MAG: V-type ATP synthase subunit F [Candidatus Altiarchaeota archaeon]
MHLIGDRLTVTGLRLAGLKKAYEADGESVARILNDVKDKARVILLTQNLARHVQKEVDKIRADGGIVIEIPDRFGGGEAVMDRMIKEAIGFDLKK